MRVPGALVCAVPVATSGVTLVCRESVERTGSAFDHPLASRFGDMDCVVLFDDVFIPWEQVFLHANVELYNHLESSVRFLSQVGHQVVTRQIAKTVLLLGVAHVLSDTSGIGGVLQVQEKLGEMVTYLETLRSCLRRAEFDAVVGSNGVVYPHGDAMHAALRLFPMVYPRLLEILRWLGAGSYMMTPSARDLESPIAERWRSIIKGLVLQPPGVFSSCAWPGILWERALEHGSNSTSAMSLVIRCTCWLHNIWTMTKPRRSSVCTHC